MKLRVLKTVCALGLVFTCAPAHTEASAPVTHPTTVDRLLSQYEQTKDKELLTTLEKISEHEQKTAQTTEKYHFWFVTIMASLGLIFAFSFICILFDAWQKGRYRN